MTINFKVKTSNFKQRNELTLAIDGEMDGTRQNVP
jgi:hypothetical protein